MILLVFIWLHVPVTYTHDIVYMKNIFYLSKQPFRLVLETVTGDCDFLVSPYTNQVGYYNEYYILDHLLLETSK